MHCARCVSDDGAHSIFVLIQARHSPRRRVSGAMTDELPRPEIMCIYETVRTTKSGVRG